MRHELLYRTCELSLASFFKQIDIFTNITVVTGKQNARILNSNAIEKVLQIMNDFDDIEIQISGCKIMAHIAISEYTPA